MPETTQTQTAPISFHQVHDAVYIAILKREFGPIDQVIDHYIDSLAHVHDGKTPVFEAVETMLRSNRDMSEETRAIALDLIVGGLREIFARVEKRLGQDKDLLKNVIDSSCNHLSHTRLLDHEPSGTLADIIEWFTEIDGADLQWDTTAYGNFTSLKQELGLVVKFEKLNGKVKKAAKGNQL